MNFACRICLCFPLISSLAVRVDDDAVDASLTETELKRWPALPSFMTSPFRIFAFEGSAQKAGAKGARHHHSFNLSALSKMPKQERDAELDKLADQVVAEAKCENCGLVSPERKKLTATLALRALAEKVPGDFVETGVYTGGTAVILGKVLADAKSERKLWAADSFEGLPNEDKAGHSAASQQVAKNKDKVEDVNVDKASQKTGEKGEYAATRKTFEDNLALNGLDHGRVNILQGWFKDTLPTAAIKDISFLRLDGDLFVSTWDAITPLYDKVSPGGFIYVDDYGSYDGCRAAIEKFRMEHNIKDEMVPVKEVRGGKEQHEAVWWQKKS
eukprot:TRINITY_DN91455_c0_g1_i1.p1 TRINITY_DN91455_c0_g1~~TRINITY_DN91455_c0_g1_i1.p1  ORF type:complete len:329 (+),score=66.45 TRINITY_DN91455_c0_g1_i1:64-1050(+)